MFHTLYIEPSANKQLRKLPQKTQKQIRSRLDALCANPGGAEHDVKKLRGREGYRLRCGDYRVIYTLENARLVLRVIEICHRQSVY